MAIQTAEVYQALSKVCADVAKVKVVYGVLVSDAGTTVVQPLADELVDTPAILLVPGPWENIAGGAARINDTAHGTILVRRDDPGEGVVRLLEIHDLLIAAFAARSKAYATVPILQSVLVLGGDGLSTMEWPEGIGELNSTTYLTWPFRLEVKRNPNDLAYQAA